MGRVGLVAAVGGAPTSRDTRNATPTARTTTPSGTSTYSHQRRAGGASAWRAARPAVTGPPKAAVWSPGAAG